MKFHFSFRGQSRDFRNGKAWTCVDQNGLAATIASAFHGPFPVKRPFETMHPSLARSSGTPLLTSPQWILK